MEVQTDLTNKININVPEGAKKNLITHCPVPEDGHKIPSQIGEQSEGKSLNRVDY